MAEEEPRLAMKAAPECATDRPSWVKAIDENGMNGWIDSLLEAATQEIHLAIETDEIDSILEKLEGEDTLSEMLQEVSKRLTCSLPQRLQTPSFWTKLCSYCVMFAPSKKNWF